MVDETLDSVIDLATGKWEPVGKKFEVIMHRGMPIVIGFGSLPMGFGNIVAGGVDSWEHQVATVPDC